MNSIQTIPNRKERPAGTAILRAPRTSNVFSLSSAQRRIWLFNELEPGNPVYNIPLALRIDGSLSIEALRETLNELVRRHEILRTRYANSESEPVQMIDPPSPVSLCVADLSALENLDRETMATRLAETEALRPFDLSSEHPLRATLLRLDNRDHALLLTLHHIAYDGWSMGLLGSEISTLYQAFSQGQASPLPDPLIQYADFAIWQQSRMTGKFIDRQLTYWKEQLKGCVPLEIPTDRPRPLKQTFSGAVEECVYSPALEQSLGELSRQEGVSLFMTLLAAFKVLLHRYCDQTDIVVGSPIAGRTHIETRSLMGCFLNTLSLRSDLSGNPSFRELLRRVRGVAFGAYSNQDLQFEQVVAAVNPDRGRAYAPIFQVMFTLDQTPAHPLQLAGSKVRSFGSGPAAVGVDWDLTVMNREGNGLRVILQYATDLFDRSTIVRALENFRALLEAVAANPDRRIGDIELLSTVELLRVEENGNGPLAACAEQLSVAELIARQAVKTPDAVAVVHEEDQLTYRELTDRAAQLACYLRKRALRTEGRVAVCLERSPEMLISMLGIWLAGATYAPLDMGFPAERLAYLLEDLQPESIITTRKMQKLLPLHLSGVLLLDDREWTALQSAPLLDDRSDPRSLAYVIYTSGSTGLPKGAMVEHRGLINHLWAKVEDLALGEEDLVAQTASAVFDISIWQFLAALIRGGRVEIFGEVIAHDSMALLSEIERTGVTVVELVPGMIAMLTDQIRQPGYSRPRWAALRWMISTGEGLPMATCEAWKHCFPSIPLLNAYGPTECSDDVTHYEVAAELDEHLPNAPLGKPIRNLKLYVLDRNGRQLPIGVIGELGVGGIAVGRGYLNKPDLTAERFVPDPFASDPGGLLYRTGDRVRWLDDGNLDYLGRCDDQVKIRGYRVELGEIEGILHKHPNILYSTVIAVDDPIGGKRLAAYVVANQQTIDRKQLQAYIQSHLPAYMTPSTFVFLEELPRTSNGKVDRKRLPPPNWNTDAERQALPSTPVEELLAGIWMDVLQLETIGVDDNFFDLGGHSLLATQVVSRIRHSIQIDLPLKVLFEFPTVFQLAAHLEKQVREQQGHLRRPFTRQDAGEDPPLSSAQRRLWFLDQLNPGDPAYNIHIALRVRGPLDLVALSRSLAEIIRRHDTLRTKFVVIDGNPMPEIIPCPAMNLVAEDFSGLPEADRENLSRELALDEVRTPFDLKSGQLLRARVVKLADQDHVLMVTMHHIAGDGWSVRILIREFTALYTAFSREENSPLPELQSRYADYAASEQAWLQSDSFQEQLAYWKQRLGRELPVLELSPGRPRSPIQPMGGAAHLFAIPAPISNELKRLSRREGCTIFMTMLAAFQALLYRYTGERDLLVGTDITNRFCVEIEELIGFFVNQLIIRSQVQNGSTFRQFLSQVREVTLDAYANQDVPFERIVEELAPARDSHRAPLFQVKFILQQAPPSMPELPGLALTELRIDSETAKLDLLINLIDNGDLLTGAIEYNTASFDRATIEAMADHWLRLLKAITDNPDQKIDDLALLSEAERQRLLSDWNAMEAKPAGVTCIHEAIQQTARRNPDAIAVVDGDHQLTYQALNERSNQLAHYLKGIGIQAEVRVAVCLERSAELVIALLAVLKSGGAYVPLDAAHPLERLGYLLEDAQPAVLLTSATLQEQLPAEWMSVVTIDGDRAEISTQPGDDLAVEILPQNLAYLIYTSGSTGRPKGVMVSQAGLINYLTWAAAYYNLSAARAPWHTSTSFDLSVTSLWVPLVSGGCIEVVPESKGPEGLRFEIERSPGPAVIKLTPAHAQALAMARIPQGIQALVIGGEALDYEMVRPWRPPARVRLINEYGPTETVVGCCIYEISASDPDHGRVPIGRPIQNNRLYVLSRAMELLPIGAVGELYISGDGVARGYWQHPSLTAERFLPNPFGPAGDRIYRTGDQAYYREDGTLEYLGRTDHQLKVRGYRIEAGEVEAALNQHPDVQASVVIAREDRPGDKTLTAYFAPSSTTSPAPAELQLFLRQKLPEYMVPVFFVPMETLPLTSNGKIDRKALPSPFDAGLASSSCVIAPRTAGEDLMAGIWRAVLNAPSIGVMDNFFQLGGHSLLATQLISRVNDTFRIEMPLKAIFDNPTLESFTRVVAEVFDSDQFEDFCVTLCEIQKLSDAEVEALLLAGSDPLVERPSYINRQEERQ